MGALPPVVRPEGRWPANVILTDPIFDGGIEGVVGGGRSDSAQPYERAIDGESMFWHRPMGPEPVNGYGDSGTYSRFFLIPKASRSDREPMLGGLADRRRNHHPTVKPVALMRHLVRLVTPPGGLVLDPFVGSGSTLLACEAEGFRSIGIDLDAEYVAIAQARLRGVQRGLGVA